MKIKKQYHNLTLTYWDGIRNVTVKFSEANEEEINGILDLGYIGRDMLEQDEPKKKARKYEGVKETKSEETPIEEQDTPPTEE